jgi:hypothetical protein
LDWVRFPDGSVLAAVAESATVTTMVTSEGKSLTEIKLVIKNQAQPFLKVALPKGVNILSADVAGERVKPVQGADGSRVPLLRPGFRPTSAYTVSFVFMHDGAPFAKKGGAELSLPNMDIPISLLNWEVFLPERYKVKDFGGDVIADNLVPPAFRPDTVAYQYERDKDLIASDVNMNALLPGQLGGVIADPSGATVPNARVTVTNQDAGYAMNTVTDQQGRWVVSNVPTGRIRINAQAQGFRNEQRDAVYDSNQPSTYSFALNVGTVSESVTVTAETSLPLNGRSYSELHQLKNTPQQAQASANVVNLQKRVAGVLPVAIEVPRAGTSFAFVRPLVMNEETKVTFSYKSR